MKSYSAPEATEVGPAAVTVLAPKDTVQADSGGGTPPQLFPYQSCVDSDE